MPSSSQSNDPDFIFWGWRSGTAHNDRSVQSRPVGAITEYVTDRAYSLLP